MSMVTVGMPRGPRLDAPEILHHLMMRGIEKRGIFETNRDREDFLGRLERVLREEKASCFA
jgi:putative transposase